MAGGMRSYWNADLDTFFKYPFFLLYCGKVMVFKRNLDEFYLPGELCKFLMFYKMRMMTSCVTWKRPFPLLPMASCSDLSRVDSFSEFFPKKLQINPRIVIYIYPDMRIRNFSEILFLNQEMNYINIHSISGDLYHPHIREVNVFGHVCLRVCLSVVSPCLSVCLCVRVSVWSGYNFCTP